MFGIRGKACRTLANSACIYSDILGQLWAFCFVNVLSPKVLIILTSSFLLAHLTCWGEIRCKFKKKKRTPKTFPIEQTIDWTISTTAPGSVHQKDLNYCDWQLYLITLSNAPVKTHLDRFNPELGPLKCCLSERFVRPIFSHWNGSQEWASGQTSCQDKISIRQNWHRNESHEP